MRKVLVILLLTALSHAWSCKPYALEYRKYSNRIFGIQYPYQLLIAQAAVESKCTLRAISDDGTGSKGLGQITWRWWSKFLTRRGVAHLCTIDNQVRAQLLVLKDGYKDLLERPEVFAKCGKQHWIPFQIYNGGRLLFSEIAKSESCSHPEVRKQCKRRTVVFKNGSTRNACDINYDYSVKILTFATKYYGYTPTSDSSLWKMFINDGLFDKQEEGIDGNNTKLEK